MGGILLLAAILPMGLLVFYLRRRNRALPKPVRLAGIGLALILFGWGQLSQNPWDPGTYAMILIMAAILMAGYFQVSQNSSSQDPGGEGEVSHGSAGNIRDESAPGKHGEPSGIPPQ